MLKKVGILANGGDVSGFNAVIRAIVKTAENHGVECYGIVDGYNGLLKKDFEKLSTAANGEAVGILPKGGSIIGSSTNANIFNYKIVNEYVDNGYSGILNSRPELDKMIRDITLGKIDMLIVKDMSRLTRDKNLTSYFTDIFFPDNDVRLISVTEYVDTGERYEIDDAVALRGIVNQSYLEDISKKIKAVKTNLKNQGKFIEASVAYGYKKDNLDKRKIVIDEEVSSNIIEIFNLYIDGIGPVEIANRFNKRKIKTPSQYLNLKHQAQYWTKSMIARILDNPIYCGRLVTNKYYNDFKLKKTVANRKGNYQYISDTHQPIIAPKIFDKVQEMKKGTTKENQKEYVFLLRDLVYCKNCGRKMLYKNSNPMRIDKYGKVTGAKNELGYFICAEHYRHQDICNEWIKIKENTLNEIVLKQISNKLKKLQLLKYANDVEVYKEIMDPEASECKKIKNEITRREADFKILYSKKVEEIISEDEFVREYNLYKKRVTELKEKLDRLEEGKKSYNSKNDVEKLIIEFSEAKKFDNKILKKLVEKIEIGKDEEVNIILKV